MESVSVVIAAGGKSGRMDGINKLLAPLGGVPVIIRTVKAFHEHDGYY
jgi:CTP:molybdopterin cytidylyltransferase MocA